MQSCEAVGDLHQYVVQVLGDGSLVSEVWKRNTEASKLDSNDAEEISQRSKPISETSPSTPTANRHHKVVPYVMACKGLPSKFAAFKAEFWATVLGDGNVAEDSLCQPTADRTGPRLRGCLRLRHGQRRAAEAFGVSRQTVWRFHYRDHVARRLPRAVLDAFGGDPVALISATWKLNGNSPSLAFGHVRPFLPERLRGTLLLLCATPLATVEELSCFGRVPGSTLRDRLARLTERELADSIPHRLSALGPHPRRRYFPTEKGIVAAGAATKGREHMLEIYPVSRQWMRLLAERLDAVAVLSHVAAMVAEADPSGDPARVDHYRHDPYDLLIALSGDRSIGLIRHGPALPTANLRYLLRSKERLDYSE